MMNCETVSGGFEFPLVIGERARILEKLEGMLSLVAGGSGPMDAPDAIRRVMRARALRNRFFETKLFADPAWDMLLTLYETELSQRRITVSSVCNSAGVPPTTAFRWLNLMESEALVRRVPDPRDRRRIFVQLTEQTRCSMDAFFSSVQTVI